MNRCISKKHALARADPISADPSTKDQLDTLNKKGLHDEFNAQS